MDGLEKEINNQSFFEEIGSILHYACDQNKLNLVKYLIEKKVPLNVENKLGMTPLCIATHLGYEKICEALLRGDGNTNCKMPYRAEPNQILEGNKLCALNYAATYGRTQILKMLVEEDEQKKKIVAIPGISKPIIHSAVFGGNYEVTK